MLRSAASSTASDDGAPTADHDRGAGDGRLLHELERQPAADAEDVVAQREEPVERGAADDLVHRVVAADVLAHDQELAVGVEEAGRVQAAGPGEGGLAQTGPGRAASSDRATVGPPCTGGACTATSSSAPLPHTPHEEVV